VKQTVTLESGIVQLYNLDMSPLESILAQAKTLSNRERHELMMQLMELASEKSTPESEFEEQMAVARAVMAKRKKALAELAK
jgi:hypothetical protein